MTDVLTHTKQVTRERVVSHMNGVGASVVNYYPMIEEKSWNIQRPEAMAIIALGSEAVGNMDVPALIAVAPFLVDVCAAQFGSILTAPERAAQVWAKALQVQANAVSWAATSAYVNGLRARMEDRLATAETVEEVFVIESEIQGELSAFRNAHGV